jgi:peroxiredoxin (alkyl hydroperoxide reductase subunit C)
VTFIVDPNNEIQFVSATAGSVGRNVDEALRVWDALQSDELCACNWRKGDPRGRSGGREGGGYRLRCGPSDCRLPDVGRRRLIAAS